MNTRRFSGFMPVWPCIAVGAFLGFTPHALASPYTPKDNAEVIGRLPFRVGDSDARQLTALRAAAASAPEDQVPAVALAQKYIELAMARSDPRYIGYAEAIVAGFSAQPSAPMLMARAVLRQFRHEFEAALDDFAAALNLDKDLAGAHAWRGAIYLVRADYTAAAKECEALRRLRREVLFAGCAGLTAAYTGKLETASQILQQALAATNDDEHRLWLHTRLGEVAAWQGKPVTAERHYRQALATGMDDGYLLAAWSDFLLDQNRPAEVIKLLANWESSDGLLLRLTEAESVLGLPGAAAHRQALEDRFAAAKIRGDTTHRAEEARFQLRLKGDAKLASTLAAENYTVQKEPRDARILLEAAIAAGEAGPARAALTWLQSSGFEDARLRQLGRKLLSPAAEATQGAAR